jgi:hypothetical protein
LPNGVRAPAIMTMSFSDVGIDMGLQLSARQAGFPARVLNRTARCL